MDLLDNSHLTMRLRLYPWKEGDPEFKVEPDPDEIDRFLNVQFHPAPPPSVGYGYWPSKVKFDGWDTVLEVRQRSDYKPVAYIDALPTDDILQPSDESRVLYEMIGDYSQNYLECSYNEDDILRELINGTLDENIRFSVERQILMHFEEKMGDLYRDDGTYAAQLFDAVIAAGGWARQYMDEVVPMDKIPGLSEACAKYLSEKSPP